MSKPLPGETQMTKKDKKLRDYLTDQHAQGRLQHITLVDMIENQFSDAKKVFLAPPKLNSQWESFIQPSSPPEAITKENIRQLNRFADGNGQLKIRIDLSTFDITKEFIN